MVEEVDVVVEVDVVDVEVDVVVVELVEVVDDVEVDDVEVDVVVVLLVLVLVLVVPQLDADAHVVGECSQHHAVPLQKQSQPRLSSK